MTPTRTYADPERSLPALTLCLRDTNPILQRNAIWSLTQFGKDAEPAVPALHQFLQNAKYEPATAAATHIYIGPLKCRLIRDHSALLLGFSFGGH